MIIRSNLAVPWEKINVNYSDYNEIRSLKYFFVVFSIAGLTAFGEIAITKAAVCVSLKVIVVCDDQFHVISGESGDVTTTQTDQWTTIALAQLLRDYNPQDIFNADESSAPQIACAPRRFVSWWEKIERPTDSSPMCET